jgi:hypothetical protein
VKGRNVKKQDIKPGWYRSAMRDLGYRVRVHSVHDGRVYFSRPAMDGRMSISAEESFRGIVVIEEED